MIEKAEKGATQEMKFLRTENRNQKGKIRRN